MWKSTIRENLGVIFAFAVLILLRIRKQLLRRLVNIVAYAASCFHRLIQSPAVNTSSTMPPGRANVTNSSPDAKTLYDSKYPNSVLYFRRRFFGSEYFIVQSLYVAVVLFKHAEYFENVSFVHRICRHYYGSKMSSTLLSFRKRLLNIVQTYIEDDRNEKNVGCRVIANDDKSKNIETSSFPGKDADVDKTYRKFAMEMSVKREQQKVGHLYQSFVDDDDYYAKKEQGWEPMLELEEVAAANVLNAKNLFFESRGEMVVRKSSLLETIIPSLKNCVKEMTILLEAKANRRNEIDIREYGYRHAVNILGVCVFGKSIEEITGSKCEFYANFDELYRVWVQSEKKTNRFPNSYLKPFWMTPKSVDATENVTKYFETLVKDCIHQRSENETSLLNHIIVQFELAKDESPDEIVDSLAKFSMAFSICVVEILGGIISILTHELSRDAELQEKIREKDKVEFNLEGSPCFDVEFLSRPLYINSLINETFKTFPIDPFIQLTCKQLYRIPNTNFQINPNSAVLIPVNVLQNDNNHLYPGMDSFNPNINQKMENKYNFITGANSEMQSFFVFAYQFIDVCLKSTVPSLIQVYEFKTDVELNYDYGTSCRFSTLPSALPLRPARVEKRGKIVIFEESLKAFHASRGVPFLSKIGL